MDRRLIARSGHGGGSPRPGFVDLQVNGFAGVDLMATDREGYARVGEALLATGTTAFQPTFVTAPEAALIGRAARDAARTASARASSARTSRGRSSRRGGRACTTPRGLAAPDLALLRRLLDAAPVSQVTLAPELPGAFELIDELVARGITVSRRPHRRDRRRGAPGLRPRRRAPSPTSSTRCGPSTPRDPSIALAALARTDVIVQMIVDLHHVAAGHRDGGLERGRAGASRWSPTRRRRRGWATASSCSAGAGSRPRTASSAGPRASSPARALTMIDAVRNLHGLGVPLEDALRAAARGARAGGAARRTSAASRPGAPADVVVLDDRLEIRRVLVDGRERVGGRS